MPDYELIRQIPNLCKNNQMRDVRIEEITCADPAQWVRDNLPDLRCMTCRDHPDGSLSIFAQTADMVQEFHFTPL